jgi:purine-binding chemotaxis protein CheW
MTRSFDWELARVRLDAARAALVEQELTPEQERAVLVERARLLAIPDAGADADAGRDFVRFTLCGGQFAVDAEHVLEATSLGAPTPVPGTPDFLLGVVNHRGRVLPVFDLRRQLVPHGDVAAELTQTVAVAVDGLTFAIAAESVEQTTRERVEDLDAELVTVLDLETLAADPRLRIDDE